MRAQQEVQLSLRNSYYINAAPQILFICMAAAPCAAGDLIIKVSRRRGQYTLLKRSCYSELWYYYYYYYYYYRYYSHYHYHVEKLYCIHAIEIVVLLKL